MRALLLLAALQLAACGGPVLWADAQAGHACVKVSGQAVPGSPVPVSGPAQTRLTFSLKELLAAAGENTRVTFTGLELTAKSGIGSFAWVDTAKLTAQSSTGALELVSYKKTAAPTGPVLALTPAAPVDVTELVEQDQVAADLAFTGKLPSVDWSFDAEACFALEAEVTPVAR